MKNKLHKTLCVSVALVACSMACSALPDIRPGDVCANASAAKVDPWVLETTNSTFDEPFLLWNGKVGYRINPIGEVVSSMRITDYEQTGKEKIKNTKYDLKSSEKVRGDYRAALDMRTGEVTLKFNGQTKTIALNPGATALSEKSTQRYDDVDIEIDGPIEDQQAVRSFMFYLRTAIDPSANMSISPFALSNTKYNGHIFWDADTWVFPALVFIDPEKAKAILDYRRIKGPQSGSDQSVPYPWESSVSGKEVAPGHTKDEIHIWGDVAWAQHQGEALGIVKDSQSIIELVGKAYQRRATSPKASSSKQDANYLELKGVVSPDENHLDTNNDLFTNLLAQWAMNGGNFEGKYKFKLPKDKTTFLTYDDDALRRYKQTAALLAIYPLQYPPAEEQAKAMMDRFGDKVIKSGPAMSDSIHALIWARLGKREKAYSTWLKSWKPFLHAPFLQFSEKRDLKRSYFTTGPAGSLQTVLYGFLGIRLDNRQAPGAAWSKQLPNGDWLSIKPNLPPAWKSVKFVGFHFLGKRYTLTVTHTSVQMIPLSSNSPKNP